MHPVLVEIGSLKIYSYGVLVAIGFLAAIRVAAGEIGRRGMDIEKFYDLAFWLVLGAIVGARLFHVLVFREAYVRDPAEIFRLWNGGLVFYGGFLGAVAAAVVYLRRHRIPFLPVADAGALGIPLGLVFGRLGCTAAGCCFGRPTTVPWAIVYTDPASLAPPYVPLHPTQLYEALAALAIFLFLYMTRKRFQTPGMLLWTMLILYGVARGLLEFFRDDPRGFLGPLSESQIVSAVLVLYAAASIGIRQARNKST